MNREEIYKVVLESQKVENRWLRALDDIYFCIFVGVLYLLWGVTWAYLGDFGFQTLNDVFVVIKEETIGAYTQNQW